MNRKNLAVRIATLVGLILSLIGPMMVTPVRANDGTADSNLAMVSFSVASGSYALSFDGNDDIVRAAQVPGTGPLTVEAWVRPDGNNASGLLVVGANDYDGWSLELNYGQLTLWLSTNQGWQYVQHATALQAGQWVHVAATYQNGTARVFVNGAASAATSVGTLTQGPSLSMGGFAGYPFFDGTIDEVRISNIVRYTSGFVPSNVPFSPDTNTLGLYHFDEGAGQTAADASTSANDGTLGNSDNVDNADPTWVEGYVEPAPPANTPPVAMDDSATTNEDTAVTIDVLANDSDVDGDTLAVSSVTQSANGSVVNNGVDVTYTPDADYCGSDSFGYTVSDGNGGSDTATVNVSVTCINDAPVADDQDVSTTEDTPVDITLTASDVDEDALTFAVVDGPTNGVLTGSGATRTYTPDADYTGPDSFTFQANDGTVDSNIATVTIEVTEVNTPPVADDQDVSTDEDTPVDITLTGSDEDGDALTYQVVDGPTNGVLSGSGATQTYTPGADYNGPDSLTFRVNDGQADSDPATVSITVIPVNDPPVADDQAISTSEDTPVDITLTASDVDEDALTFAVVDGPTNGVLSGDGANLAYTPNEGYTGADSFTFQANDEQANSNLATVSVTVSPAGPTAQLEFGSLTVGGTYVTVNLDNTYVSPVVVCSAQYDNNTTPVVVRVSNVTPSSFDVRLQNPSGGAVVAENVSYIVVEEGTWTIDGVNLEAQTYLSTVTDEDGSWVGEAQSYGQSYTNPVVLGQVMSENDSAWSVFWSQGSSREDPPSATALTTGKMVGEDTDTTRADETIGFIVFEAGHGIINGVEFEAALGADTIQGVGDSPPYVYDFNTSFASDPEVALTTLAGMDGPNGGWAQTHGSTLATATSLYLSINEDQIGDSERNHITEQVGYVVFDSSAVPAPTIIIAGTPLSAFSSVPGSPSAEQSYTVSGSNLTDDITITAPDDFEISLGSGGGFGPSLTLSQSGGSVAETTIYVRFNRATEGTSSGNITHTSTDATTRNVAVSGTAAPLAPVSFNILLGRPTDESVTANIIPDQDAEFYIEYGTSSGAYTDQISAVVAAADEPIEVVISGLSANTQYFYRIVYRQTGTTEWNEGAEYSFDTQKASGSTFTFTIIADSHLGQYGGQTSDEMALYEQTILNVDADQPDFHIDLGDTSAMDPQPLGTGMTEAEAEAAYLVQRPYMGLVGDSVPIYLVIGNHENEEGWNFDDVFTPPDQSLAIVGMRARKIYFPNPIPDGAFYTGNTDPFPDEFAEAYGDEFGDDIYREDYYAWEWGDVLFVVLDVNQYSMIWPNDDGSGYGGEGQDGEVSGDRWDWTLGIEQYLWLKDVLESSDATFKFVFSHHVTGGATPYGRGGISAAPYFEWGGQNADGTWGWDTERPASEGWDVPIHQLMVANGVDAYFHGHDHIYAYEELDGIVYLECPKPDDAGYSWEPYGYGYTEGLYPDATEILTNSGHIRVTVSPAEVTVEYVRAYLPGDGTNGEVAHSFTILADSDNTPPEAVDDSATRDEDTGVTIDVLANDSDADGDTLTVASVTQPPNGSVVNNGTDVTYTPDADYCGSDSFTYTASDGNGGSDTATVDVTVTCVNDAPVADDQAVSTTEDTPVDITLTASDVEEDPLTFAVVDGPTNGTLSGSGANLTYTPDTGYTGPDSFTFRANDGQADSNIAMVTIKVSEVNDPPVADDDSAATDEDVAVTIDVLANDGDVDGTLDPTSVVIVTPPSNGSTIVDPGTGEVTYTPDPNYSGSDSFTYTVEDNDGASSNEAAVTVTVDPVNDAPVADDQDVSTTEDTPVDITLTASDVEEDPLTYTVVDGPMNGTLSGSGANLTYTPNAGYTGADSFTFRANDGQADSNIATVSISVTGGNYALSFDGSDDVVRAGEVSGIGPLTIEAWVRPDDSNADGLMIVGADDYDGWSLELNSGQLTLWLSTSQGWQYVQHGTALQAGQWVHVAATYQNGTARAFVNGVASTATSVGTLTQGPSLSVGGFGGYPFFDGTIDEVRISNIVRYTSDFVPSSAPFSPDANTLGLYHFDEGAGQTAADASTSANDGTLGSSDSIDSADPTWVEGYPW